MPKQNRKPGIHLHTTIGVKKKASIKDPYPYRKEYYWILIAKNGKTIAKSSETYKSKRSAVKSIRIAAREFAESVCGAGYNYYDHSKGGVFPDIIEF